MDFWQGVGASGQGFQVVHAGHGFARVLRRHPNETLDLGVQGGRSLCQFRQATVRGQGLSARMAQDVGHLVGIEHEVDRHHDRTAPCQCKAQGGKSMRVAGQHRHLVALSHAHLGQPCRQSRDQGIELGIGPGGLATDNACFVRQSNCRAAQGIGNGLAAHYGMNVWGHEGLRFKSIIEQSALTCALHWPSA